MMMACDENVMMIYDGGDLDDCEDGGGGDPDDCDGVTY